MCRCLTQHLAIAISHIVKKSIPTFWIVAISSLDMPPSFSSLANILMNGGLATNKDLYVSVPIPFSFPLPKWQLRSTVGIIFFRYTDIQAVVAGSYIGLLPPLRFPLSIPLEGIANLCMIHRINVKMTLSWPGFNPRMTVACSMDTRSNTLVKGVAGVKT